MEQTLGIKTTADKIRNCKQTVEGFEGIRELIDEQILNSLLDGAKTVEELENLTGKSKRKVMQDIQLISYYFPVVSWYFGRNKIYSILDEKNVKNEDDAIEQIEAIDKTLSSIENRKKTLAKREKELIACKCELQKKYKIGKW